jgi:hypothetical protein
MKKLKMFIIVLTVVSTIFLGYSLYLHYSSYVHRSYAKVNYTEIAIGNMLTELDPNYTKYFSSPPPSSPWYVQYAPEIVIAILITLLGLLYKRRSKK